LPLACIILAAVIGLKRTSVELRDVTDEQSFPVAAESQTNTAT
jgi:hypothetical protein